MQIADCYSQTVTDYDGNVYNTVQIGNQIWFKENLKVTHYSNGDSIPNGTGIGDYSAETEPKYYFNYNNDTSISNIYGKLYTCYTATDYRGLCPTGWHLPSTADFYYIKNFLGGEYIAGGKIKEAGTTHWLSPNTGATNSSNFTALGSGYRYPSYYTQIKEQSIFWTSNTTYNEYVNAVMGCCYKLWDHNSTFYEDNFFGEWRGCGFSVRCIKDQFTILEQIKPNVTIKIYFNQLDNCIHINRPENITKSNVNIYDIAGKEVLNSQYNNKAIEINTENFPKGVYLIKVNSGGEVFNEKVVIN